MIPVDISFDQPARLLVRIKSIEGATIHPRLYVHGESASGQHRIEQLGDEGFRWHFGTRPLADKLRPAQLDEVVGQDHLLGPDGALTRMLDAGSLGSLIFWGPPGTGKTTVARLLADATELRLRADLGGVLRRRRPQEGVRRGAARGARPGRARCCSSTRSTASTAPSRTASCR